ncbi:ClpP/crotonase-like domain-containing protein [Neohortaea acidophila]|uniref:ClpP/crotonase-like domain-containing protein n=1 Tax=Neohortaea acidophila TaxID=245834 RepID=A0A6A6Q033_9PEZI|nr:ClpP/crotonase-like domain-containing protein [Neohortaea acidophila]KAF2485828.1 ClpP/crotonase-like domain-containing protein [Neohortaea acidophila]
MFAAKKRLQQLGEHIQPSTKSESGDILCTVHEHSPGHNVAHIIFSNPTKLNVASGRLLKKLIAICSELGKDPALRVVVLSGAPPTSPGKAASWIGGADIQELSRLASADDARKYIAPVHEACVALQNVPVPVIARVNGYALGAGLELMISCDLRIVTKASRFGMPEAKIGLPSVVEAALFPSYIGIGRTRRLVYLAENIPADTAEKWGLVERIVEDEGELDRAVEEWVDTIVGMGPQSIRNQKRLMRRWEHGTLQEGIEAGVEALAESYEDGGKEAKEYMKRFLGKRR